jgi:hypothetical protein
VNLKKQSARSDVIKAVPSMDGGTFDLFGKTYFLVVDKLVSLDWGVYRSPLPTASRSPKVDPDADK